MVFAIQHLLIFFQIYLVCLVLSISGFLLKKLFLDKVDLINFEENALFGFVLIGFLSLFINFFSPLNILVNNIFFVLIIYLGLKFNFFYQEKIKLIKKIFIISLISFIFLIYSNVNTPDALLYHLPYSKIINEDKIIIGLTNLDSRFGHISIFQYISSFFVNSFFSTNGLLIPISLVPSLFFVHIFKKFKFDFKKETTRSNSYITFLILIISIYSFSRYSGWGNDAQVHIFYFLGIIYFLELTQDHNNLYLFYKLSIISIFTFFIKPFYFITLMMPLILFLISEQKIKIIKSKIFIFLNLFLILWLLKNFLISSCFLYPINITCNESTSWYSKETSIVSIQGEAWSKDWSNQKVNSLNLNEFISNFNWVKTWSENHLKIIIEKTLPVIIFIILNIILLFFTKCLNKNIFEKRNILIILLFLINLLGCIIWFIKFPIFRYGLSYIYSFMIISFYFIYIKNINWNKLASLNVIFITFIYIAFLGMVTKNINRIYTTENKNIYPQIYDKNFNGEFVKIYNRNGTFIHYKNPKGLCGYTSAPCTLISRDIGKDKKFGYSIFKANF